MEICNYRIYLRHRQKQLPNWGSLMASEQKIKEIRELIKPICDKLQVHLIDIELRGKVNNQVLSIFADTEDGITMDQITELTHEVEDVLDIRDPLPGKYRLEVSSPGIRRPLKQLWQFRKNRGNTLRVLFDSEEGRRDFIGILKEVNEQAIVLQLKKQDIRIPLSQIVKAQIKLNW